MQFDSISIADRVCRKLYEKKESDLICVLILVAFSNSHLRRIGQSRGMDWLTPEIIKAFNCAIESDLSDDIVFLPWLIANPHAGHNSHCDSYTIISRILIYDSSVVVQIPNSRFKRGSNCYWYINIDQGSHLPEIQASELIHLFSPRIHSMRRHFDIYFGSFSCFRIQIRIQCEHQDAICIVLYICCPHS